MTKITIAPDHTFTVVGMRGTGKTTLCQRLVHAGNWWVWDPLAQYPPEVSYRPVYSTREELDDFFAQAWARAPFNVLIEEAEQHLVQGSVLLPRTRAFLQMGRNHALRWACNTRRPARLSKDLLDESDHIFIFKLRGRSVSYMEDYLDLDAADAARFRAAMSSWTKDLHRFFWYTPDGELVECEPLRL